MRIESETAGERDHDGGHTVKEAGEYADEMGLEHHGGVHKRGWYEAQGTLRRGNEKPKPVPWSRDKRRP